MFCRIPVRIEATTTAVRMPTTIPRIVRNERNLCDMTLSYAIFSTSIGSDAETCIILDYTFCNATMGSSRAAFHAGYKPATTPMMLDTAIERMT